MSIDRYEKYSGGLKQFLKQPNECFFQKNQQLVDISLMLPLKQQLF